VREPWQFFWATGALSSFLDNAPTYLTFLALAQGLGLPPEVVGVSQRVLAASGRIKRVKRLDRWATGVITLGGVFVIVAVSFILVFILAQAWPLFRPAQGEALGILHARDSERHSNDHAAWPSRGYHGRERVG